MEYYNSNIQIDKKVIADVFSHITLSTKLLVFGLGYDSKMWYVGTHGNTFFVENKEEYIKLNENDIPESHIIKYEYTTQCSTSATLSDTDIHACVMPEKLAKEGPFDIIIVDGPEGYRPEKPGRLIPCYWATLLSKPGTLVYIDDANRALETYCIQKYFHDKAKVEFMERDKCTKIYL